MSSEPNLTEFGHEVVATMQESVSYMNDTLNDVLSLQKIEEGRFDLAPREFDLADMLRATSSNFESWAKDRGVELILDLATPPAKDIPLNNIPLAKKFSIAPLYAASGLLADSVRLRQVCANFISNAIKFSAKNSRIFITAGLRELKDDEPRLLPQALGLKWESHYEVTNNGIYDSEEFEAFIAVRDEGAGISLANQKRLFQAFVQIRPGDLQSGRGTGLGLAITKRITELHAGHIGVFSPGEGLGSTFFITIRLGASRGVSLVQQSDTPLNSPSLSTKNLSSASTPSKNESTTVDQSKNRCTKKKDIHANRRILYDIAQKQSRKIRVLVTDDVASNRRLIAASLSRIGLDVQQRENGREAVDAVVQAANANKPYDIAFMDVVMPVLDGQAATAELRTLGHKDLIIIALTGNAFDEDRKNLFTAGCNDVLTKPCTLGILRNCLRDWKVLPPLSADKDLANAPNKRVCANTTSAPTPSNSDTTNTISDHTEKINPNLLHHQISSNN
eukprot:CAMPEP_0197311012 /NCGR_PEP_ID=MMETSP0891-20130614/9540_1 /TAXON_ID=44058 ORGANISM="Aureoumbra lagunensis, Strain CCMP1510" /NCGR_SAMPLE_ID=MMETSP0891 /ASSEMBLY_ACC=CAM_ASM_000534 /LENGTH=504 /DNA_ID=CAMNT_0042796923 /DNA_START=760 /DNA_END=2274 /DNA_ORIENTATION=+